MSTSEIPQNVIPMRFGLYEARGYDLPIIRRFDRLWRQEVSPESPSVAAGLLDIPLELREVTPRALRTLRLLGVTHILRGTTGRAADPPYKPTDPYPPLDAAGLSQVYSGPDARVYRLGGALPRAWVVPRAAGGRGRRRGALPRSRGRISTRAARRSPRAAWPAFRTRPARPRPRRTAARGSSATRTSASTSAPTRTGRACWS